MSNRLRRVVVAAVLCLAVAAAFPGRAAARGYDDIVAAGEIVIAVYRDFPPFSSRREGGELAGVDVDLGKAMAERMKLKPVFMELTAGESVDDDLRNAVWKGHYLEHRVADVMLHVPADRQFALRNANVVIFAPYFRERVVVARDPERVNSRDDVDIFAQEKVGVELASLADAYLSGRLAGRGAGGNVVHFPTIAKAAEALTRGEVAAVMGTESELAAALGERGRDFPMGPLSTPGLSKPWWDLGLAVKDSNRQLGYAIEDVMGQLRRDGIVAAIFHRHGLPYLVAED